MTVMDEYKINESQQNHCITEFDLKLNLSWFVSHRGNQSIRIVQSIECQTHDWKIVGLMPSRINRIILFSRISIVCWLHFSVHAIPVLPQRNDDVEGPSHFAKSAGGK